jgi:uncharacterized OB-fold protein
MPSIPIRPGLLDLDRTPPRLLGGCCQDCRRHHFPAQATCPYCASATCEIVPLSERGTLYLATVVHNPPPGYRGQTPYGFGVVELPEGLRIISPLTEARLERLQTGTAMRLQIAPLFVDEGGMEVLGYAFAPEVDE